MLLSLGLLEPHGETGEPTGRQRPGLTETALHQATRIYAQRNGLTPIRLRDITRKTHTLVKALRHLAQTGAPAEQVYVTFRLHDVGYSPQNWKYYAEHYRSAERIRQLEALIPENEETIIRQLAPQLRLPLERLAWQVDALSQIRLLFPSLKTADRETALSLWCRSLAALRQLSDSETQTLLTQCLTVPAILENDQGFWHDYVSRMRTPPSTMPAAPQTTDCLRQRWLSYAKAVSLGHLNEARAFVWRDTSRGGPPMADELPLHAAIREHDLRPEDVVFRSGNAYCLPLRQVRRGTQETTCLRLVYLVEHQGNVYLLQDAERPWAEANALSAETLREMSSLPSLTSAP